MSVGVSVVRDVGRLFPRRERLKLLFVLTSALVVALFEALGVASIVPFMAVMLEPQTLERYGFLAVITGWFGAESTREQLLVLGIVTILIIVMSNGASAIGLYIQQRFFAGTRRRLTTTLFEGYLRQPYAFHAERDSSTLLRVIFGDAENTARLVASAVNIVARALVIMALVLLLVMQNPQVALVTLFVIGGAYGLIYVLVQRRQGQLGAEAMMATQKRHQALQEGLGGIKDLMVLGREHQKVRAFFVATVEACRTAVANTVTGSMPRYLLEPIAFGGVVIMALVLMMRSDGDASSTIPTLALYAFVGYRLLPALQAVFNSAVDIRFSIPSLRAVLADWQLVHDSPRRLATDVDAPVVPIAPDASLELNRVSFTYPGARSPAIRDVSLRVRQGESIGLIGRTGSGKTTLVDIILGLYTPTSGTVSIGDVTLDHDSVSAWRRHVGYVPQQVFLANASIAENIAFGLSPEEIDRGAVERAGSMAQIDEFIRELPNAYDTLVGERGVRLSGGQRQRIGIARALYNEPEILVFDEATSALDGLTEEAVMQAIHALSGSRTVILIAHRLKTVAACDRLVLLEQGRVEAMGSYAQLLATSERFQRMVGVGDDFESASIGDPAVAEEIDTSAPAPAS